MVALFCSTNSEQHYENSHRRDYADEQENVKNNAEDIVNSMKRLLCLNPARSGSPCLMGFRSKILAIRGNLSLESKQWRW